MTEDDNILTLKDRWQKLGSGPQTEAGMCRAVDNAVRHRTGRLTRKVRKAYNIYAILGVTVILCGPMLKLLGFSWITAVLYLVFGSVYTIYALRQRRRLVVLDEVDIPCVECARRVLRLRKSFDRWFMVSPLVAIPVLYSFGVDLLTMTAHDPGQRFAIYSVVAVGVIGGVIGLVYDLRTRRSLLRIYETFISEGDGRE